MIRREYEIPGLENEFGSFSLKAILYMYIKLKRNI